ncbi:flagellar hook-associated protein 3 FlgL [Sphingomonas sp. PP-CE-3A-406]|uniref:flagellin N-terminal helical domain-containing protein n=1 Tax=Sphingomonas sp. PP-CE-3A-406 TaxID=2135659 RepID=UPI000EF99E01|nr:flagellin [Sphingomonas sp. PP-CE-3A-406]RMB51870.1 flagellar hook-associated protein 3 FlgL [Sphingomonas sp. PP-CE-3A-406]
MQIPTSLFYDRSSAAMTSLSSKADALNAQISTGKRFTAPSQDSVAYQRLAGLARDTANDKAYAANLGTAESVLKQGDTSLSAMSDQLQNATVLVTQAKNGTLSALDRKAIGEQIAGIVASLTNIANAKDARGQPLFGGSDGAAAVATDGSYALASKPVTGIPIGDGQSVQANETAARIFTVGGKANADGSVGGGTNTLAMLSAIATALQSDDFKTSSLDTSLADISAASDQVSTVQASLGARAARVDLESSRLTDVAADREETRSGLEDTDATTTFIELQKTMTILSATQASFTKLSALSLFDYLR